MIKEYGTTDKTGVGGHGVRAPEAAYKAAKLAQRDSDQKALELEERLAKERELRAELEAAPKS